jgi:hypothetical protein
MQFLLFQKTNRHCEESRRHRTTWPAYATTYAKAPVVKKASVVRKVSAGRQYLIERF